MHKLASVLDASSYYDDELGELFHHHDAIRSRCQTVFCNHHMHIHDKREALSSRGQSSAHGRSSTANFLKSSVSIQAPLTSSEERSTKDLRRELRDLTQSLLSVPSAPLEPPLLAQTCAEDINSIAEPTYSLEACRRRLHCYYDRRRLNLVSEASMLSSRQRRFVRDWQAAQQAAAPIHNRFQQLQQEIEAAESRIRRLKEVPGADECRPVGKACTGSKLFGKAEPYKDSSLCCIFRSDFVVYLRDIIYEEQTGRVLRRFLQQLQHLQLYRREAIWHKSREEREGSPLPLIFQPENQEFKQRLKRLARKFGCCCNLRADEGHDFARHVVTNFPVIFRDQEKQINFEPYPDAAEDTFLLSASGGLVPLSEVPSEPQSKVSSLPQPQSSAGPFVKEGSWHHLALLQPRVDQLVLEQRLLMSRQERERAFLAPNAKNVHPPGRQKGPVKKTPKEPPKLTCPCDIRGALKLLKESDAKEIELHWTRVAKEQSTLSAAEMRLWDSTLSQAPEQHLRSFYLLRHLEGRALRSQLLSYLNAFRSVQQRIARILLESQIDAEAPDQTLLWSEEETGSLNLDSEDAGPSPGSEPPSLASGRLFRQPGELPCSLQEALTLLSDEESLVWSASGEKLTVVDAQGVSIIHSLALSDLEKLEEELLNIGETAVDAELRDAPSNGVTQERQQTQQRQQSKSQSPAQKPCYLDPSGLLVDLFHAEVKLHEAKWQLIEPHLQLLELVPEASARREIMQRIVDILADRPRFDLDRPTKGSLLDAYAPKTESLIVRSRLLRRVLEHQLLQQEALARRQSRQRSSAAAYFAAARSAKVPEDPQLSIFEGLAHENEGIPRCWNSSGIHFAASAMGKQGCPTQFDLLDFCPTASLVWQVDLLVEQVAEMLAREVSPEVSQRHSLELAAAEVVQEAWLEVSREVAVKGLLANPAAHLMGDPGQLFLTLEELLRDLATLRGERAAAGAEAKERRALAILLGSYSSSTSLQRATPSPEAGSAGGYEHEANNEGTPREAPPRAASPDTNSSRGKAASPPPDQPVDPVKEAAQAALRAVTELFEVEFEDLPMDEVALRLCGQLIEHVLLRHRLNDMVDETSALETILGNQAETVGSVTNSRCEPVAEFNGLREEGVLAAERDAKPHHAADLDPDFGDLDSSTREGLLGALRQINLRELRVVLQHETANRWLYAAAALHNTFAIDQHFRTQQMNRATSPTSVAESGKAGSAAAANRPGSKRPRTRSGNDEKRLSDCCFFPGTMKQSMWLALGSALRDRGRPFKRHCHERFSDPTCVSLAVQSYKQRFLVYASLLITERACDLFMRVQAARATVDWRALSVLLPPELSPFCISEGTHRFPLLEADGSLKNIFHIPEVQEVLEVAASSIDWPQKLTSYEESAPKLLTCSKTELLAGKITPPKLEVEYTGPACMVWALLSELVPLTSLYFFFGSIDGDRHLLLRMHHAVDQNRCNLSDARAAVSQVLEMSMLGPVQMDDMERVRPPVTSEQATWDALQTCRTDLLRLKAQIESLGILKEDPKLVLSLLRRKRQCAVFCAGLCLDEALGQVLGAGKTEDAVEIWRWSQYLLGYGLEGGSTVVLPGLSSFRLPSGNCRPHTYQEVPRLTMMLAPGQEGATGLREFGGCSFFADDEAARHYKRPQHDQRASKFMDLCPNLPTIGAVLHRILGAGQGGQPHVREVESATAGPAPGRPKARLAKSSTLYLANLALEQTANTVTDDSGSGGGGEAKTAMRPSSKNSSGGMKTAASLIPDGGVGTAIAAASPLVGSRRLASWSKVPSVVPAVPLQSMSKALYLISPSTRLRIGELRVRLEMRIEVLLSSRDWDLNASSCLDEELELCRAMYSVKHFGSVATCFKMRGVPPRTANQQQEFQEVMKQLQAVDRSGQSRKKGANEAATTEQHEEQQDQMQAPVHERAKEEVDATVRLAEQARNLAKQEMQEIYDTIGRFVLSINKSVVGLVTEALEQRLEAFTSGMSGYGGELLKGCAKRLHARGTLVKTFGEDGGWVLKEHDLCEIVDELGSQLLRWGCRHSDLQLAKAKSRVVEQSLHLQRSEQNLTKARLHRSASHTFLSSWLSAYIADKGSRQLLEVDRLHRALHSLGAASSEMEHRIGAEIRRDVIDHLTNLDGELLKVRSRPEEYKADMMDTLKLELRDLRKGLLRQLRKMAPLSFALQQRVKQMQEDPVWTGKADSGHASRAPPGLVAVATGGLPVTAAAPPSLPPFPGPLTKVPLVSASGYEEPTYPVEDLHKDISLLQAANSRLQTFRRLAFQNMKSSLGQRLHQLESNLSSNTDLWEHVTDMRERERVINEELVRARRRMTAAASAISELDATLADHGEACTRLTAANEAMTRAQREKESEMHRFHREGSIDVKRMQADCSKMDSRLYGLKLSGNIAFEALASARESRDVAERKRIRLQAFREQKLMQKASTKVHLIKMELERGHTGDDDESILTLAHDEVQEMARRARELEAENSILRDKLDTLDNSFAGIAEDSDEDGDEGANHPTETIEETLCYSVSLMTSHEPAASVQERLAAAAARPVLPELRSRSEPPPSGGSTSSRPQIALVEAPRRHLPNRRGSLLRRGSSGGFSVSSSVWSRPAGPDTPRDAAPQQSQQSFHQTTYSSSNHYSSQGLPQPLQPQPTMPTRRPPAYPPVPPQAGDRPCGLPPAVPRPGQVSDPASSSGTGLTPRMAATLAAAATLDVRPSPAATRDGRPSPSSDLLQERERRPIALQPSARGGGSETIMTLSPVSSAGALH